MLKVNSCSEGACCNEIAVHKKQTRLFIYLFIFFKSRHHDDCRAVLLPDHFPEVIECLRQRTLSINDIA